MESFLLPSLHLQRCIIHEGSVKSINPVGSVLPSGTLLTQWIIGGRAEILIWPVRNFMWSHWITGLTLHMHVLRRWRSEAVCVFMNQAGISSTLLMMQNSSRTALIHSACVSPDIYSLYVSKRKQVFASWQTWRKGMMQTCGTKGPISPEMVPLPLCFSWMSALPSRSTSYPRIKIWYFGNEAF